MTTSDASGFYSYQWTPDITGKYTVIATFGGTQLILWFIRNNRIRSRRSTSNPNTQANTSTIRS